MKRRMVFLLLLLILVSGGTISLIVRARNAVSLHVLDVGQGDATLVRAGRVDVLVDGGPDATVLTRLGEVRPFWDRHIEVVILTHPEQDHLRGLRAVLEREHVGLVMLPEISATTETFRAFIRELTIQGTAVRAAYAGQRLTYGDLTLDVLAPDAELLKRVRRSANVGSVVLRGTTPNFAFLLTGDIEAPTEQYLVRRLPKVLAVDVLKVPHHGSKTSSTSPFLRAVRPQLSVVSVGARNRYGHPHESVLRRYAPGTLFRTDEVGTVSLRARRGVVLLRCQRGCKVEGVGDRE